MLYKIQAYKKLEKLMIQKYELIVSKPMSLTMPVMERGSLPGAMA